MPAVKYAFAPIDGEFKGVRIFGQMVKHLAATNHILAAAALGEDPPADAGDEMGPEAARTKPEIVEYLNGSFAHLAKAMDAVGGQDAAVKSSPISPLQGAAATRLALRRDLSQILFTFYLRKLGFSMSPNGLPKGSRAMTFLIPPPTSWISAVFVAPIASS